MGEVPFRVSFLIMYPHIPEIQETGTTYRENAILKAEQVAKSTDCFALGDDTGLEVDALGGRPGLYSARFAGEGVSYDENNKKLLSLLEGIPESKRQATFYCVMALNPCENGGLVGKHCLSWIAPLSWTKYVRVSDKILDPSF